MLFLLLLLLIILFFLFDFFSSLPYLLLLLLYTYGLWWCLRIYPFAQVTRQSCVSINFLVRYNLFTRLQLSFSFLASSMLSWSITMDQTIWPRVHSIDIYLCTLFQIDWERDKSRYNVSCTWFFLFHLVQLTLFQAQCFDTYNSLHLIYVFDSLMCVCVCCFTVI